jgi:hypothetical protein
MQGYETSAVPDAERIVYSLNSARARIVHVIYSIIYFQPFPKRDISLPFVPVKRSNKNAETR